MTRLAKKQREESSLKAYSSLIGLTGTIHPRERPDFVVTVGNRRIGFEVTEYHQPKHSGQKFTRTEVESAWDSIKSVAAEYRSSRRDLDNLEVYLAFAGLEVPSKKEIKKFVELIVKEIDHA